MLVEQMIACLKTMSPKAKILILSQSDFLDPEFVFQMQPGTCADFKNAALHLQEENHFDAVVISTDPLKVLSCTPA
jgi:hypothetical protein